MYTGHIFYCIPAVYVMQYLSTMKRTSPVLLATRYGWLPLDTTSTSHSLDTAVSHS